MTALRMRIAGCIVAFACFIAASPASGTPLVTSRASSNGHRIHFDAQLERLAELGVPRTLLAQLADVEQSDTFTGTFTFSEAAGNLDGKAGADAFITTVDYEITIDWGPASLSPTIEERSNSRVQAVAGTTGKVLWAKRWKDFTIPMPARVGRRDLPGAIALSGLLSMVGPFEDRRLVMDGLDGRTGKRLWRSRHQSVETSAYPAWAGHDVPVSLSLFDGVRGRSTDLLLGVAEVAYLGPLFTTATQAIVIDGRTGREERHDAIDTGVNWIVQPAAVADLDDDGLDDYVVPIGDGPHLGNGQDLPSLDGVVHARRSVDGEAIWTETGFDLNWLAWPFRLADVVGSDTRDIGLMTLKEDEDAFVVGNVYFGEVDWQTYLIDGDGIRRWRRWGGWPFAPGDLDRDGRPNVVTRDFLFGFRRGSITYRAQAYHLDGKLRWKRTIRSRFEPGPCPGFCSASIGSGAWSAGDIDGDGVRETYVRHEVEQDPGDDPTFSIVLDGTTGTRVRSGGEELHAAGISFGGPGTDLVEIEIENDTATVRARDGRTFRALWETELALNGIRAKRGYVSVTGVHLDGDGCGDLLLSINVERDAITAAFSGASGKLLWDRVSKRDIRLAQPSPPQDHNRRC